MPKVNRNLILILTLLFITLVSFGCYEKEPSGEKKTDTVAENLKSNEMTLNLVADIYPPFQIEENGELKGIAADVVKEAFRRMGYNVNIHVYPWSRALDMALKGETDGIFSIFKTADREENYLDYPKEALYTDIQRFYVRTDSHITYNGALDSLKHYTIGTMRGYDYGQQFHDAIDNGLIKVEPVDKNIDNINKLLNQRIELFVDSQYATIYNMKHKGLEGKALGLEPPLRETNLYVAFSKKRNLDKNLVARFDKVLSELKKEGYYNQIIKRYM